MHFKKYPTHLLNAIKERADEVQELLKLESIGRIRATLNTSANTANRIQPIERKKIAKSTYSKAKTDLLSHLKLPELSNDTLVEAVNERRTLLGLTKLNEITPDVKVSDGIISNNEDKKRSVPRSDSIKRIKVLKNLFSKNWCAERGDNITKFFLIVQILHPKTYND